jgi:molybdopterin-containing oxidoreductase family iron-sulfur binding subunit
MTGSGEFTLVSFEHSFLGDGRFANVPWAQEAPDPLSGQTWDTWVVVSRATAAKLGLEDDDLVTLTTATGSIDVGVEILPVVRDDVVAVPFGNGHTSAGRYTDGIGKNVIALLSTVTGAGGVAWQQAKVSLTKAGSKAGLTSAFGMGDHDPGRNWVANAPAAQVAEHGDAPSAHPGELTGIHHLPMDRRLQERGITDFYPAPDHPTYRFAMTVDTDACTGCGACSIACYAENNLPVVGKRKVGEGREMAWIRINRYLQGDDGEEVHFLPLMCQQCAHAPCESVCPVLATYHTLDGLNAMVYNRCAGTRYCSNACPYSLRRFNYHSYTWPEPFNLQLNPDVVTRTMGVMEKCTFCVQRIRRVKSAYKDGGAFTQTVPDAALTQLPACADACPSQALTFGNLEDENSKPTLLRKSGRTYTPIHEINTMSAVNYLAKANFHKTHDSHGGDHAAGADDNHEPAHDAGGH